MDKASLHCIGRNFRTSGLVYNEISGIKNVEEVAKGTHCMSILWALYVWLLQGYINSHRLNIEPKIGNIFTNKGPKYSQMYFSKLTIFKQSTT